MIMASRSAPKRATTKKTPSTRKGPKQANLFTAAKKVSSSNKATPSSSKPKTAEIPIEGLDEFAIIKSFSKRLEGLAKILEGNIKDFQEEYFITKGMEDGKRPSNFKGVDEHSSASCQLKKISSSTKIPDEALEILKDNDISYDEEVVTDEHFVFNSEVLEMPGIAEKISEALSAIPELKDQEVIRHIPSQTKLVLTDRTIEEAFEKISDKETIRRIIPMITQLAVVPKLSPTKSFHDLKEVLLAVLEQDEEEKEKESE
jgi:hypothetical protein